MSVEFSIKNSNNSIIDKEGKDTNKSNIKVSKSQSDIHNLSNSKILNNSKMFYPYPICLHTEKDPFNEYKLRIIKAKNKGSDTFLKNYLKFNFPKNDIINNNDINNLNELFLESNKNKLFITENKKFKVSKSLNSLNTNNANDNPQNQFNYKRILPKSKSDIFNPYSQEGVNNYKESYLKEMEKRGNLYNKRKMAYLQRIALHNFSSMNMYDNHYVNGSIPSGKSDESYVLETKKRKKLPGMKEYLVYRLKNMKDNEMNTPEYYLEKSKKLEKNKLPEIIDIKNSGRFKFHVYHDQYGFRKELDKRENRGLKMTKEKIRDLKIMAKINKIQDPELIETYKRALYW